MGISQGAATSGPWWGYPAPKIITGFIYLPQGCKPSGAASSTTANLLFYSFYRATQTKTWTGVKVRNSGTGDNGDKFRCMAFSDDGANGGPGTLLKDFGEGTLTGAAATISLASSLTISAGQGIWLAHWSKEGSAWQAMTASENNLNNMQGLGDFTANAGTPASLYVSTAYGAAPSTAVAPTGDNITATFTNGSPLIGLYV